jgi:hypothetical protein
MMDDGKISAREEQARLAESVRRQLGVFCPLLMERDVVELMLNANRQLWVDRLGRPMTPVGRMAPVTAESFIAMVASVLRGQSPVRAPNRPRLTGRCVSQVADHRGSEARRKTAAYSPSWRICMRGIRLSSNELLTRQQALQYIQHKRDRTRATAS